MKLKTLQLQHYRNYEEVQLQFDDGVHIFIGENAQGKTNLMEAIYVLAMSKSHRTTRDRELIQWNQDTAFIKGSVDKRVAPVSLELSFSKKGKMAKVNYLEQKKLSSYLGQLNVILFAPEDLALVKGSPANRRRFMDMELGQMNPIYLYDLVQYNKLLKQRNTYLKQLAYGQEKDSLYLEVLTEQLATIAASLLEHRIEFLEHLELLACSIHTIISQEKELLSLRYQSSVPLQKNQSKKEIYLLMMEQFKKVEKRELEQMTTLVGPHRDDVLFFINDRNVQIYGSQGQQRSTVLSLKLAEIELMKEKIGEYPILLLDDVLSELDDDRQTHLIKAIENKVQTFLTTTSLDGIQQQFITKPTIISIHQGTVQKEEEDV